MDLGDPEVVRDNAATALKDKGAIEQEFGDPSRETKPGESSWSPSFHGHQEKGKSGVHQQDDDLGSSKRSR